MPPLGLQRLLTATPLLLIGSLASADAITGQVVDANGVGVAGVDIDLVNLGSGGNPHELNDGTDANGNFLTTVDPGVYEVRFYPPVPPSTTLLTGVVSNVVVVGTKNMGTITLTAGVSTQGTIKNAASVPVGSVKVDVYNATTGAKLLMKNNVTNAFGSFNVAVPANTALRTELLTSTVVGQVLVPRELFVTVTAPTNLGTLTMQTGFHVSGTVRTQAGTPVANANTDFNDSLTGASLFTPSDNTNSLGVFDVVLPAGTFDLQVERPPALVLVGAKLNDVVVSAATNVGILTMRPGVFLSGTVRDVRGAPVQAADVNVYEVSTGVSLPLGADNTNLAGFYSVVVPIALLDVVFSPPGHHSILAKDRHDGINVTANTTLEGQLPSRPSHLASHGKVPPPPAPFGFGAGTPGTAGSVPQITGALGQGSLTLRVFGGKPYAAAHLWLGVEEHALVAEPGIHVVHPMVKLPVLLDALGSAQMTLPSDSRLSGGRAFAQFAVLDREARFGIALSHVLAVPAEH